MSCGCNSKRQNRQNATSSSSATYSKFRYIGSSSLTVTGGTTRQVYRFTNPGAEALIDQRDVPGMSGVPNVVHVVD